jgi:hypothetical protein
MSEFFKDGSFEIEKTKNYILSIQVCLDGFSFLVIDPNENQILAIKNSSLKISNENLLARHLKGWLESEALLKNPFKIVRLFYYSENFTLVPEEYFGIERHRNLTSLLFDKKLSGNFIENKIENIGAALFFPVPQDIINVLNQFFKNIEIIHPITNLIQSGVESGKGNLSFIMSTTRNFYFVVVGNGKLLLANSFQNQHPNDLVYNVINAFQQLEISRSETELFVAVAIDQKNEIESLLNPYFSNISILKSEKLLEKLDFPGSSI